MSMGEEDAFIAEGLNVEREAKELWRWWATWHHQSDIWASNWRQLGIKKERFGIDLERFLAIAFLVTISRTMSYEFWPLFDK